MIVVADSGSTKTDWIIFDDLTRMEFKTKGINPFFLDNEQVKTDILKQFPKQIDIQSIEYVHFYGPACSTIERCQMVQLPLNSVFPKANITVKSDLLGAARALFQKETGIACILGTGSNSGLYNGDDIVENITSTGYILGDEGSGAHLGLELVKKIINHQIEKEIEDLFYKEYQLSAEQIIDKVYKGSYPNRFLANFTPFINKHINLPSIYKIVEASFSDFIDIHILPYPNSQDKPIACVGSIAFHFKELLQKITLKKNLNISKIISKPIYDLAKYHGLNSL